MDTEVKILALITWSANATKYFRFPISNGIRLSIWKKEWPGSTSAALVVTEPITIATENPLAIIIALHPKLIIEIEIGDRLLIGTFPEAIGEVRVLELLS